MKSIAKQAGVSLLEVLVGFVIFTSSLVGILNYVSGQIYHLHLSSDNLKKYQLIYEHANDLGPGQEMLLRGSNENSNLTLSLSMSTLAEANQRGKDLSLNQYDYSVTSATNSVPWSVIKLD
jgi:Tfp pilus assembly protein PilV